MTSIVEALKHELAGYQRRGLTERAKAVMEQLVILGCEEVLLTHQAPSLVSAEDDSPAPADVEKTFKPRKIQAQIKSANAKRIR